jgi:hypothetical protein
MTTTDKVGRNDPCPCGSGKKYKKCCLISTAVVEAAPPNNEELNGAIPSEIVPGTKRLTLKSYVWKGYRWRIIWNGMHYGPLAETFHDFLIVLMRGTFGKDWSRTQDELTPESRHVVARWLDAFKDLANSPLRS